MGLAHATGVKSSIINGANSFLVILIASLIFHQEKLTGPKIIGCVIGFAGVILVNLGGGGLDLSLIHILVELSKIVSKRQDANLFLKHFMENVLRTRLTAWLRS